MVVVLASADLLELMPILFCLVILFFSISKVSSLVIRALYDYDFLIPVFANASLVLFLDLIVIFSAFITILSGFFRPLFLHGKSSFSCLFGRSLVVIFVFVVFVIDTMLQEFLAVLFRIIN